ncbi:DEAD/DEAH box helicase [Vogesella sp. XCS3]|uniref:SNF2-related protein n=1 Tax=Vogesella sp. XCS3 TaxID=2877939 RepID=UPI001D0B8370|nr:DEAD/DEAH box helicase [Vogesella sp. XCS3]UDM18874.1 DEAD/DEAH box helicase [Vogesella sp. XCS3]
MNFGQITHKGDHWHIACEAHVRTKIKRLFPEVDQRAGDSIILSDNPENCRDLLWLVERYPMEIHGRDHMAHRAAEHIEQENVVAALLQHRMPPDDFELAIPAREYQCQAATLLHVKEGLLLADQVGLGKTVTSICAMARKQNLPVLVVTLTHLPSQWAAEILVFDEIQELRRTESNKYAAAKFIASKAPLRLGLSATPIYNYGVEFFNVIDVVRPGVLGTKEEFCREWCNDKESIADPRAFGEYLRREGIMLRRTRADVGRELPPVTKIPQYVECDQAALDKIKGSAVELAKTILAAQQNYRGEKFRASEEFNVLMRQATGISKAPFVAEFVRLLLENGEKVVLYGWHREVYGIWLEQLAAFKPRLYTGTESPKEKEAAKLAFTEGDCRLLIISLRSGAGLDGLQHHCRTVVFGELDWSPGVHEQCIGRVDRDEQTEAVMAYFLIAEEGSDPIIADVLGLKRNQIEAVRDPNAELIEKLEVETGNVKRLAESYLNKVGVACAA